MADGVLTIQQQQVVDDRGGTLLVSAAAGSGKTRVLVERVLKRVVEEGLDINQFLIITFTNAAAAELRTKISDAISQELAKQPGNRHLSRQLNLLQLSQISTIHAFCGALLRQYGYALEIPADYRIMEDSERKILLDQVLETLLEDCYEAGDPVFLKLADTMGAGRNDQALAELVKNLYEKVLSQPDPQRWLAAQDFIIPENSSLEETPWGKLLIDTSRSRIQALISRYHWAVNAMIGDEKLGKSYLPCYRAQLCALEKMLLALEGPWDSISGQLTMDYPRVSVTKYPDPIRLDMIKAVKNDGKKELEGIRRVFSRPAVALIGEQNAYAPVLRALCNLVSELDRRFSVEKRRKNLLDFSDQEHLAIRLLVHPESGRPTEIAQEVSQRFQEIMVDEYQDSNRVQETIFTAISNAMDTNRFLVGDVKQSIYGFRQAEPGMFLEKYEQFREGDQADAGEPRKRILSRNFRSRPEILEAVNHTFQTLMSPEVGEIRYDSEAMLYPGLEEYPKLQSPCVEMHVLSMEPLPEELKETKYQREAIWVAGRVVEMLEQKTPVRDGNGTRPVRPEDIAILFRTREPAGYYARALREAGIPVAAEGGQNLFETPEVRVLVNLLRVLSNPHQDVPLLSVLCCPVFRFSNQQLAQIRAGSSAPRFYDAMRDCQEPWCQTAFERLEQLRRTAGRISADQTVSLLLHDAGLLAAYSAMDGGSSRRENLLAIYQLALKNAGNGFLFLHELLRILDRTEKAGTLCTSAETSGVQLTTIHKSKGLEYPVVFLPDLTRQFNFRELSGNLLYDGELGIGTKITDLNLQIRYPGICYEAVRLKKERVFLSEELRILYVAMTRPKDYLIMTYAGERVGSRLSTLLPGAGMPASVSSVEKVTCLGDWVLLAALNRIESGALHAVCGRPDTQLIVSEYPWMIDYQEIEESVKRQYTPESRDSGFMETDIPIPAYLVHALRWRDPHILATKTPSKLTATQLKGRIKDAEVAENAKVQARIPALKRPELVVKTKGLSATEKGTAVHLFLQYADYGSCTSELGIIREKERLEDQKFMSAAQLDAVEPAVILRLFHSEMGALLLQAGELVREFKFSLLQDASAYYPQVVGETMLLQGVVDAAVVEPDGITVVDFKTDRVTKDTVLSLAEHYRGQLNAYRNALERIFQRPVKAMYLYFLTIGREVRL